MKYGDSCGIFIDVLYQIENVAFYFYLESLYLERMLNFVQCFLVATEMMMWFFLPYSTDVVY